MDKKLHFAFWGTPDVASETLEILKESGYMPSLIVTSPDAKKGRGLHMEASPAALFAKKNNIPCIKPENLKKGSEAVLSGIKPDLFIVVAYGKIIPESIINMPRLGSINIHYSLLPKYRGASPVESAILNGDKETGVTIQKMAFEMDSGPILAQEPTSIAPEERAPELRKRLIRQGGELLIKILPDFIDGKIKEILQIEKEATYCKKIRKEDGLIDPSGNPAANYNKFRAYAGWPRTFFFKEGKRIIITDATLEDDRFIIKKVLPEGKKEVRYDEFLKQFA